jgi:hypothetical protein
MGTSNPKLEFSSASGTSPRARAVAHQSATVVSISQRRQEPSASAESDSARPTDTGSSTQPCNSTSRPVISNKQPKLEAAERHQRCHETCFENEIKSNIKLDKHTHTVKVPYTIMWTRPDCTQALSTPMLVVKRKLTSTHTTSPVLLRRGIFPASSIHT